MENGIFEIEIEINSSCEKIWSIMTDFQNYPRWNSVLSMRNNNSFILGKDFNVEIYYPDKKVSKFKAKALSKKHLSYFSAHQTFISKWVFRATHYFIIERTNTEKSLFKQKWTFDGVLFPIFKKQIFKELEIFNKMNSELKNTAEKS